MGNTVIQTRNDTASNWTSNNPTLALGEIGLEIDTSRMKVGDGSTAWNSLAYYGVGASFKYGLYTLSADQTSNLSVGNHIEFDTAQGSLGGLSTGSGQDNGIITLPAGKTYKIRGAILAGHSSNGGTNVYVYDRTNSTQIGTNAINYSMNNTSNNSGAHASLLAIVTPASDIDIDVRFLTATNTNTLQKLYTWLLIEEYGGY